MLEPKVHLSQMHIATKSSKLDISSEKKLEEFAQKLAQLGDYFLNDALTYSDIDFTIDALKKVSKTL